MGKKQKIPQKLQVWIDVRRRYRLSDAQIQMARELGMNPKKFGGLANHKQEAWKRPLPEFIEDLYLKRFGKACPEKVRSIEQLVKDRAKKKLERKMRKEEKTNFDQIENQEPDVPF